MEILAAGFVYALLTLDHMALGPFMLSRPIVVGPVLGACLGDASMGFAAGAVAELFYIGVSPGGLGSTDVSIIGALAAVWASSAPKPDRSALAAALLLAIPCGLLVREVDFWIRKQNSQFTAWVIKNIEQGRERPLLQALAVSLVFWFLKSWLLFVALGLMGQGLLEAALPRFPARVMEGLDLAGRVLPLMGFAVALRYFSGRAWRMQA